MDKLSLEEQETLMDVLSRRAADRRRDRLGRGVQKARKEFKEGRARPATPDDIMSELLSWSVAARFPLPTSPGPEG